MKLLQKIHFEVVKNDRIYRFETPIDAPLGEVYDSAHEILQSITALLTQETEKTPAKKELSKE